ncbi:MAG: GntR family transcriptional regulator [Chloroflexia bacterium]|nr:GntR family transcriptional regulator [Chloroflexia bacterium]
MAQLRSSRVPLYLQAQQYLLQRIEDGTYAPGEQLPSEADLAAQLGISRPTLREALLHLEQEGLVVRKHGVGTFVSPSYERRLESGLERLESILEQAERQGLQLQFTDLHVGERPAEPELAEKLQLPPGTPLTRVERVILVKKKRVAYMLDLIPAAILGTGDLEEGFNGSALDLLRNKPDLAIALVMADIIACNADAVLADRLSMPEGQALLLLEELLYDEAGTPINFSRNYFRPEFFRFHVVRR